MLACFLFIVVDVIFSLVFFQTKKTLFVVVACVMAIPFSKNLIGYLMILKYEPLTEEQHSEAEAIAAKRGMAMAYDVSVTAEAGILFYPCVAVYNNNVIGLLQPGQNQKKKDYHFRKLIIYIQKNTKQEKCARSCVTVHIHLSKGAT